MNASQDNRSDLNIVLLSLLLQAFKYGQLPQIDLFRIHPLECQNLFRTFLNENGNTATLCTPKIRKICLTLCLEILFCKKLSDERNAQFTTRENLSFILIRFKTRRFLRGGITKL